MKAKEKLTQYGLPAMTDRELLDVLKWKKDLSDYYASQEYRAAKELQRRQETSQKIKITRSGQAAEILNHLQDEDVENFYVIHLNRANFVISTEFISRGTSTATVVNVQKIIKSALDNKSQAIILAHNHPSGNRQPSAADTQITKQIKEAARLFDISLLDHVIITKDGYFSFADEGMI